VDYNSLTGTKTTAGSIAQWVNRTDLPTAEILNEAQAWIYQRMRVREMTVLNQSFSWPLNSNSVQCPADFLDGISFQPWGWGDTLPFSHEESMLWPTDPNTGVLQTDTPSHWTIIGLTAYVDVLCSAIFSGYLLYYGLPAALGPQNLTNWLTIRYPRLVRRVCMGIAFEFAKDTERMNEYLQLAENDIAEAARTNDMFRRSQYLPSP